ncbi:hypothetical protein Ddc_00623 [Ditylenchus destructor]|nr:hypothetical protein Ddc_00623 [Ditylenchus destructor]
MSESVRRPQYSGSEGLFFSFCVLPSNFCLLVSMRRPTKNKCLGHRGGEGLGLVALKTRVALLFCCCHWSQWLGDTYTINQGEDNGEKWVEGCLPPQNTASYSNLHDDGRKRCPFEERKGRRVCVVLWLGRSHIEWSQWSIPVKVGCYSSDGLSSLPLSFSIRPTNGLLWKGNALRETATEPAKDQTGDRPTKAGWVQAPVNWRGIKSGGSGNIGARHHLDPIHTMEEL